MENHYELKIAENNNLQDIREINELEFNQIRKSTKYISDYNRQFLSYTLFQLNLLDFDQKTKPLQSFPAGAINIGSLNSNQFYFEINRVVFNILFSFKYYLDSSEAFLKRKYGKDSIEASNFIKLTNEAFDNVFAYRFLSKLRDYAQHVEFPIHVIPFEVEELEKDLSKNKGRFKLIVSREKLLQEKIGARLKKDLESIDIDIDVTPLIYRLGKIVADFEFYILELQGELIASMKYIEDIALEYKTESNSIVVMFDFKKDQHHIYFSTMTLPFDQINGIKKFIQWRKNWR